MKRRNAQQISLSVESTVNIKHQVDDVISRRKRDRTNIRAVVDVLVIVDYALYRDALNESGSNENVALGELRTYYKLLVAMVGFALITFFISWIYVVHVVHF